MKQFLLGMVLTMILCFNAGPSAYHPRKFAVTTRAFNTPFQAATDRDVFVNYTVTVACTISLTTGQSGIVYLETSPDNTVWTTVGQVVNTNTGSLTIGLNLTSTNSGNLFGMVQQAYWCRLRTSNVVGTPTFAYIIGYETLL